jgi:hypothetical protein
MIAAYRCARCMGTGWVCQLHRAMPGQGPYSCGCGCAGAPCISCNDPKDRGANASRRLQGRIRCGLPAELAALSNDTLEVWYACKCPPSTEMDYAIDPSGNHWMRDGLRWLVDTAVECGYPNLFLADVSIGAAALVALVLMALFDRFDLWQSLPI